MADLRRVTMRTILIACVALLLITPAASSNDLDEIRASFEDPVGLVVPGVSATGQTGATAPVTFTKDIAPILQRSCQNCHQPNSVAPMSLVTYEEVRPWARAIKVRTSLGPVADVMPPWYIEKDVGVQHYLFDPSLSDEELDKITRWVDNGAPRGNPVDLPPSRPLGGSSLWAAGEPDLITVTEEFFVPGDAADWWGDIEMTPIGNTEDRYVASVEVHEVNDVLNADGNPADRATVGGRFVVHHMIWITQVLDDDGEIVDSTFWPVHEVGRNADTFDPEGARLLAANSRLVSDSLHLHSNGRDTKAHLEIGWRFHPKGYKPKYKRAQRNLGNAVDIDVKAMERDQELHAYYVLPEHTKITTFEPHLHAPGARMCLEAIWGINIQTLTCAGYDHNWVRGYEYAPGYEPLLPKGTILHITGYMDNTPRNENVTDPRNWQGSGNRSVTNMFIDLGHGVTMTDDQFQEAMDERREMLQLTKNDVVIGCPLCMVKPEQPTVERAQDLLTAAETAQEEVAARVEAAREALEAAEEALQTAKPDAKHLVTREPERR